MADERLTDQDNKTTTPSSVDLVYIVDVSDTTDHVTGSSRKMEMSNFLKGRAFITVQGCHTLKLNGNDSLTALETGDFVIYQDVATDTFILATIITTITTVPADLRDPLKAANWIDASAAL